MTTTNHPEIEDHAKEIIGELFEALPATGAAFSQLQQATFANGALDIKTKEYIALGIAIAQGCDGCMAWHNAALRRMGVSREEIAEVAGVAVEMGGGVALYSAGKALAGFDQFREARDP
ncbi:MAG: AhpD family alkylhydroperoxidase [Gammaproteobacteria bacterium]|jgi:AhpD family alkylhydroperoxidase